MAPALCGADVSCGTFEEVLAPTLNGSVCVSWKSETKEVGAVVAALGCGDAEDGGETT
jgi:hypothetical protein